MLYLIDGYNLFFRLKSSRPHRTKSSLEKEREALIQEFNKWAEELSLSAVLVFDGSLAIFNYPMRHHSGSLEIVYTQKNLLADEYIVEKVEESSCPSHLCVVTSDRPLGKKCQQLGAKIQPIEEFLSMLHRKRSKKQETPPIEEDSPFHIARLQAIFEKKLSEEKEK